MLLNRTGGGGENVTPQLDEQESIIEQIQSILSFKCAAGIEFGTVTANNASSITVEHHLESVPSMAILVSKYKKANSTSAIVYPTYDYSKTKYTSFFYIASTSANSILHADSTNQMVTLTSTTATFPYSGSSYPLSGEYVWILVK